MGNADQQETRGMILTTTRTAVCEKHGEFEQQVISMPFFELPVFSQCPRCIEEEEYALAEKAKDGEPKKRAGDKFYSLYAEWDALPDKESYRVGGGCWPIIEEVSDENG